MRSEALIWIVVVSVLVVFAIGMIIFVNVFKRKNEDVILPAPIIYTGKASLLSATPSFETTIYKYKFSLNLTPQDIFGVLKWDDNFDKAYPHFLRTSYRDLKTDKLEDIIEHAKRTVEAMSLDRPRENSVVPLDPAALRELMGENEYEKFERLVAPPDKWSSCYLWLNTAGYTTPMHGDVSHVLAFHLTGRKRWTLADRRNLENCYPRPNQRGHLYCHAGNPYDSSLVEFYPKFNRIRYTHIDLLPGDLLSIPPKTLHFVHTFEPSFMVSIVLK